jgi:hypothetical protein
LYYSILYLFWTGQEKEIKKVKQILKVG